VDVEYHAACLQWCGHCKAFAADYEVVGRTFSSTPSVMIAKVDCDAYKPLCSQFGVQGFPTFKRFAPNSMTAIDYEGPRAIDNLVFLMNEEAKVRHVDRARV
jgi:protein disulfide-isomerase A6